MMNIKIDHKLIVIWLFATATLIWLMIMLGGATRLTHSGLSIVEWKPITGVIPPLNEADWQKAFFAYQQFPEYKIVNQDMNLKGFKFIFLMEYAHRLLGRLIGLVFFIPLLFFWRCHLLSNTLKRRSIFTLALGFLQGAVGWYMVKSGLVKDPAVSHYRLTLHLGLAFWLLGIVVWMLLDFINSYKNVTRKIPRLLLVTFIFQLFTMIYGAFVAGLKAGVMYNTFPLMEGQWLPSEWAFYKPLWVNLFENAAMVQWMHRTLALISLGLVWLSYLKIKSHFILAWAIATAVQLILGVLTIIYVVPVSLGTIHQGWAATTMVAGLTTLHKFKKCN